MTSFEIAMNVLDQMTSENAATFRGEMRKIGDLFSDLSKCSEEQLDQLQDKLTSVQGCVDGIAQEVDGSGFLNMSDDELFSILFFQKILEQIS